LPRLIALGERVQSRLGVVFAALPERGGEFLRDQALAQEKFDSQALLGHGLFSRKHPSSIREQSKVSKA